MICSGIIVLAFMAIAVRYSSGLNQPVWIVPMVVIHMSFITACAILYEDIEPLVSLAAVAQMCMRATYKRNVASAYLMIIEIIFTALVCIISFYKHETLAGVFGALAFAFELPDVVFYIKYEHVENSKKTHKKMIKDAFGPSMEGSHEKLKKDEPAIADQPVSGEQSLRKRKRKMETDQKYADKDVRKSLHHTEHHQHHDSKREPKGAKRDKQKVGN